MPQAKIIFSLSPVPLRSTYRPTPSITSDCVSKASLRVALDKVFRKRNDKDLYYFPSYELIKYLETDPHQDNTHIKDEVVAKMMEHFGKYYLK